jgi:hypothetical protein
MAGAAGPNTAEAGLVFAYDLGNTTTSYIGEPSTNLALFSMQGSFNADYSGVTFTDAPGQGYQGRDAKRVVANSGQWNIYRYPRSGNYTNTSSTKFTYSFKIKWADGHTPYFSNGYIYVDAETTYPGITVRAIDNGWFWCYCTYNGASSPPWLTGFSTSDNGTCLISDWQLEPGLLHPTQYIAPGGTRSVTQSLLNLTSNGVINVANASFDSNAQLVFDGTNDTIFTADSTFVNPGSSDFSIELLFNCSNANVGEGILYNKEDLYETAIHSGYFQYAWQPHWSWDGESSFPVSSNTWYHAVVTYDKSYQRMYKNGVEVYNRAQSGNMGTNSVVLSMGARGVDSGGNSGYNFFPGQIPVVKVYKKALTANEVATNFQALRYRFGI